jgi:Tfp pilus assembly pilus retraction ATPase PilT
MQAGGGKGMLTMDQSLASLVTHGRITRDLARAQSHDPAELDRLLTSFGGR